MRKISRKRVKGNSVSEIERSVNQALDSIYTYIDSLTNAIDTYNKGKANKEGLIGEVSLVEDKKGPDKYKLVGRFKDGLKELDASFKEGR